MVAVAAQQVVVMFIFMMVGAFSRKVGFLHENTIADINKMLLYVISPCLILSGFFREFSRESLNILIALLLMDAAIFVINIVLAHFIYNKHWRISAEQRVMLKFGASYTNAGFVGLPLVTAILGAEGIFYAVPFIIVFNIFQWTHGITLFRSARGEKMTPGESFRKVFLNPNIIASVVGILIFVLQIPVPEILHSAIVSISNINAPLSMMVIGSNLLASNWKTDLKDKTTWFGIAIRNFALPVVSILFLMLIPVDDTARMATLIQAACPVGGNTVLLSILQGFDPKFPTRYVCISTLLSMATLPLMIMLGTMAGI